MLGGSRPREAPEDALDLVGGEIEEYTKLMAEARAQAIERMKAAALSLGANAVTTVRFSTSYIMANASEILVYGDAVTIEPGRSA
jgi:uncharacterized protein YbjQ (UPF0145 family)